MKGADINEILLGQKEILPGLEWLGRHLSNFPGGELPEQKLEVKVDGRYLFAATDKIKPGAIKKVMQDGVRT